MKLFIFFFGLFCSGNFLAQSTEIHKKDSILNLAMFPFYHYDMERYRETYMIDTNEYRRYNWACPLVFEIHNFSDKEIKLPRIFIASSSSMYQELGNLNGVVKPGSSLFISTFGREGNSGISPLLFAVLPAKLSKNYNNTPRMDIRYGIDFFDDDGLKTFQMNLRGKISSNELFSIDTLISVSDTSYWGKKYKFYKAVDNLYVLHDSVQHNDLLVEIYNSSWKPNQIVSNEIQIQQNRFYYGKTSDKLHFDSHDLIKNTQKELYYCHLRVTNSSKDHLYIKKEITFPTDSSYLFTYFGEESHPKNYTLKAIAPGGSFLLTVFVDPKKIKNNESPEIDLNHLFVNSSKKLKLHYNQDYFIE